MANKLYSLSTLRERAKNIGYYVTKGYQHYHDAVLHDSQGDKIPGFMVMDLSDGFYIYGCFDANFDYLWDLDDVVGFLRCRYEERGLEW